MDYRSTPAGRAGDALCDLNMAGAIQALCESSLFRTAAGCRFERRIVKLCPYDETTLRDYIPKVGHHICPCCHTVFKAEGGE